MLSTLFLFGTLVAWTVANGAYLFAIAFVGKYFGIILERVQIGFGPIIYRQVGPNWTFQFAVLPLGGFTQHYDHNFQNDDGTRPHTHPIPAQGCFSCASPYIQIVTSLSGPFAMALLGLLCIAAPISFGAQRLEVCSPPESMFQLCGVPGLRIIDEVTTWQSQMDLIRGTVIEFVHRLFTGQSMKGWGGIFAWFITTGQLGATSFWAWLSSIGVFLLVASTMNLLPLPSLLGFRILCALGRAIVGRDMPERVFTLVSLAGMLVALVAFVFIVCVDVMWLLHRE